jgi:plastocyanin
MLKHWPLKLALAMVTLAAAHAADIEGHVIIKHRITKQKVTVSTGSYARGMTVEVPSRQSQDSLEFECSRVVIYLEGDLGTEPRSAVMEQRNRQFLPDTLVLPAGSTVSFPNMDPVFHNVFSLSKPKAFDLGNYPKEHTRTVTFPKPGIVFVNCHLHPNMAAAIVITPNRWNTKPDSKGQFQLHGLPPGTYTVTAWHRAAGFFRETLAVTDARTATVSFTIPLDAEGHREMTARK